MHVLLIEPDARAARDLAAALEEKQHAVSVAQAMDGALETLNRDARDLILLNPEATGCTDAVAQVRKAISTPMLVLSRVNNVRARVAALDAGADDYLVVPFHIEELLARVDALARRYRKREHILTANGIVLDSRTMRVSASDQPLRLTAKEYLVLKRLMRYQNSPVSYADLEEEFSQHVVGTFDANGISVIVCRVKNKLTRIGHDASCIENVFGHGYMLRT